MRRLDAYQELSSAIKTLLTSTDPHERDFFPQLVILSDQIKSKIERLEEENTELISLAHGIKITTEPSFAYIFFNNRYVGISPQTIHVNPYNEKNVLTVFALRHFEEYKELSQADLKKVGMHITLDKRDPARYPERVINWLKYIRLRPTDVVIGRAIASYLDAIGEHAEAIAQLQELLKTCDTWSMIYNGIGYSFSALGKYEEAIVYYNKVKELEDSHISYYNLACVYSEMKDYESCIKEIEAMLKSKAYVQESLSVDEKGTNPFRTDTDFSNIAKDKKYSKKFEALCLKYESLCKGL